MENADLIKVGKQLVSLIKYAYFGGDEPLVDDYKSALKLSLKHSVVNLFYLAVNSSKNCPDEVKKVAEKYYLANTHQQVSQQYYVQEIFKNLREKSIKFLPLKGYYIRKMYKSEDMRTSCDIDFYYDKNSEDKLDEVLTGLGFEFKNKDSHHKAYDNHPVKVEAHYVLDNSVDTAGGKKADEYFSNFFDVNSPINDSEYQMSVEDFCLYYTMHALKHFTTGGFGIRTVLDYYVIFNHYKGSEIEIFDKLKEFGCDKFVKSVLSVSKAWFDGGNATSDDSILEEFIFKSGTYGTALNQASIVSSSKDENGKGVKFRFYFKKIFPPYKAMSNVYGWLKKAPVLLPVAYVIRIFAVIFKRNKNIKQVKSIANELTKEDVVLASNVKKITGLN